VSSSAHVCWVAMRMGQGALQGLASPGAHHRRALALSPHDEACARVPPLQLLLLLRQLRRVSVGSGLLATPYTPLSGQAPRCTARS